MGNLIKIKFNGVEIEIEKGTLLIEAAKRAGIEIPHFCYHPKLKPDANCRMCLVEVEKMPKLQTSCSTPATEGMVVSSVSDRVKDAQFGVMEFLLGNHPLDCPECDQGGECQLQDFAHAYSPTTSRFTEEKRVFEKTYFGPLVEKEMNRCVSCLRCVRYCDEVIDSNALGSIDRSTYHQIGAFAQHELDCEFCGGCIQICPVGALTSRLAMYDYRPWQLKKTETICNYCGDGCLMTIEAVKDDVKRVSSELGTGRNEGDLCARGFFGYGTINHPDRLTRPAVRVQDRQLQTTWEGATDKIVAGLKHIKAQYGPQAIGGMISPHCTNEEIYLFQKLMRKVIGTPNIDSGARYGHINAVAGLNDVFGTTRLARYEDIVEADVLLAFAGELTESNPITGLKVKEAIKKRGAKLIAVDAFNRQSDAYRSHLPRLAAQHLQIKMGSEGTAILGLTKALVEGSAPLSAYAPFVEKVKQSVAGISFAQIEAATGVAEPAFKSAAALYAGAKRGVLLFGRAITRSENGYQNVVALAELAILAGQVNKPGAGILALAKENNVQGAVEMGGVTEYLPGLTPTSGGLTLSEMIDAAARGEIKALYLVGENPLRSLPQKKVEEALRKLDLLICQELFPNETTALAHIVLPATSYAEKEGRFTNHEGEIQKVRKAIEPLGNAKPDWEIFSLLGKKWGGAESFHYKDADAIWKEIVMTLPAGWPASSPEGVAARISAHAQGATRRLAAPAPSATNGHFDLQIGQILFHSGKMSTYAGGLLGLFPKEAVLMHPDDGERLGLEDGEVVEISADGGEAAVQAPVKLSKKVAIGTLLFPEHFGMEIKRLLPVSTDPKTRALYTERGRVTLSKVSVSVK
ncbi:MAG: NADH-quinone oxidoreductase subunit NuoG [Candidatus Manganitrophus sp.]|nr:NADH-quinone oxidoreductase subunit NuoG [Candidatus Manganitrophus sp.]MDC4223519.1 NADH-quinone oxidoreductase subunit NuoG [Candidatus Manganitrophus sp.]WDT70642.1 MAG: NADH-quinone oxidoreductase subunit NuoG [Candidatus Manganitrophus sp.]WDT82098.1 MAG: NADH-quinone oxidoreductase subunit NuoG [Candidatus Manganitrophus sp.]